MIHLPVALTVSASAGTGQVARGPAHAIRPSRSTTTAFCTAAAAVPSTSVAPTIAIGGGAEVGGGQGDRAVRLHLAGERRGPRPPPARAPPPGSTPRDQRARRCPA